MDILVEMISVVLLSSSVITVINHNRKFSNGGIT